MGIRELVAVCRLFVLVGAERVVLSLSNLRLMGMGDFRSETLRCRFASGVTLGDNDTLFFETVGVNFFKRSIR